MTPAEWRQRVERAIVGASIDSLAAVVAVRFLFHANDDHGNAWPSVKRIADDLGVSWDRVAGRVAQLEAAGILVRVAGQTVGRGRTQVYHFPAWDDRPSPHDGLSPHAQKPDVSDSRAAVPGPSPRRSDDGPTTVRGRSEFGPSSHAQEPGRTEQNRTQSVSAAFTTAGRPDTLPDLTTITSSLGISGVSMTNKIRGDLERLAMGGWTADRIAHELAAGNSWQAAKRPGALLSSKLAELPNTPPPRRSGNGPPEPPLTYGEQVRANKGGPCEHGDPRGTCAQCRRVRAPSAGELTRA